ncbi:unnamed protein product [Sphagnum balticum]
MKFPWEKGADEWNSREEFAAEKKARVKPPTMAELTIPEDELKRLRNLGLLVRRRLKIGRLGVTPGIVDAIHEGWRTEEIIKVKCDGPPALNMKKTHEDLESRTGGLVIWRSGGAAVVYRGKNYVPPSVRYAEEKAEEERKRLMSLDLEEEDSVDVVTTTEKVVADNISAGEETLIGEEGKIEVTDIDIVDDILEGLGPRYSDWAGGKPVPIDGDLLLGSDTVFKKPFRLLPYGMKPGLSPAEITELRHLVRHLPPHFVLGRNKDLRGVAAAIVKLWEKIEVAKVAVKRGVLNTNNERIAIELKRIAGGTLLYRDKQCFVLYRGKDFLPPAVQAALEEREAMARSWQEDEERVRMGGRSYSMPIIESPTEDSKVGTLVETLEAQAKWTQWKSKEEMWEMRRAAHKAARLEATRKIQSKVELAFQKIRRAEKEIAKLDQKLVPAAVDREHITDEEKHMFVKLGRRMHAFLLMGRRGVFSGTVQNMHLHWKYRELVKIIVKEEMDEAVRIAKMLENESGGILVDVITVSKGQAIIMYRGKNYERPHDIKPRHLLTKREALKLSLELQRKKSLEGHVAMLQREIDKMKAGLEKMEEKAERAKNHTRVDAGQLKNLSTMGTVTESSKLATRGSHEEADDDDDDVDVFLDEELEVTPEPFYRLDPLTRKERNILKKQAATFKKAAHFNIGAKNVDEALGKSIRLFFQNHAIVKLGVKGRAKGTSVADIVQQLEDATGGILVSSTSSKLIFYRGWLEERPDLVTKRSNKEHCASEVGNAIGVEDKALDLEQSDPYGSGDEEGDEGDDWGLSEDESEDEEINSEEFGQSLIAQIGSELDADVDDDRELASVDFRQDSGDATEKKLGEKCTYEEAMDQLGANDAEGSSSEEVSEGDIAEAEEDLLSAELHLMENIEEGDKGLSSRTVKREEIFSE